MPPAPSPSHSCTPGKAPGNPPHPPPAHSTLLPVRKKKMIKKNVFVRQTMWKIPLVSLKCAHLRFIVCSYAADFVHEVYRYVRSSIMHFIFLMYLFSLVALLPCFPFLVKQNNSVQTIPGTTHLSYYTYSQYSQHTSHTTHVCMYAHIVERPLVY